MYCDAHSHLCSAELFPFAQELTTQIKRVVIATACKEDWARLKTFSKNNAEKISTAYGIHPWFANQWNDEVKWELQQLINCREIDAIGEIGLDFLRKEIPCEHQICVFEEQLQMAADANLPIIVHQVKAWQDMSRLLKKYCLSRQGWLYHGFNGSPELANEIIACGGVLSLGKQLLSSSKLQTILKQLPYDKILLESDADRLSRIQQNEQNTYSIYLCELYACIARLWQCPLEKVIEQMENNIKNLFNRSSLC